MRSLLVLLFSGLIVGGKLQAENKPTPPDYRAQVAPLLKKYCVGCHHGKEADGDLSFESFADLQKGGKNGPALLPGQPESSRMIRLLKETSERRMPPEGEPRPSEAEIALLVAWIKAGARGPDGVEPHRLSLVVPEVKPRVDLKPITDLALSPDGSLLAVARFADVTITSTEGASPSGNMVRRLTEFPGKVNAIHFSQDGSQLVAASGVVGLGGVASLWSMADGSLIREFPGHRDTLYDAELSPDGTILATCSYDKTIILWDAATGKSLRTLTGHNGAVYDVAFSPDGKFLVSASADDTCKVWRIADGKRMDTLGQPLKEQYSVTFSPDGRFIVAGGADNRIRVWQFISRERPRINPLRFSRFAHEGAVTRVAYTPDGSQLVSLAENKTWKVWETQGFTELHLHNEPAVAVALAINAPKRTVTIGRLDGTLAGYRLPRVSKSTDDHAQPIASRAPDVPIEGAMSTIAEQEPNNLPSQAQPVKVPAIVQGVIQGRFDGQADADLFRFSSLAGQEWVLEVDAAQSQSPLDSFLEVLDSEGNRIERVLLQAVRDSYFTFRGKNADQVTDFRLFNWEEMDLNQYLYANGEVVKLWLYPRGPDSGFNVYPGRGNRWGYFDTTPLAHALGEPCYIVKPYPPGTEFIPNGLPVFPIYYENDDESRRTRGADSQLFFTAPREGEYLVRIRDVRGFESADSKYQLTIRPRQPDFRITIHDGNPKVPRGGTKEFRVSAERIDRFDGPITVTLQGLPPGLTTSSPIVIQQGQIDAYGIIHASEDAPEPTEEQASASTAVATAKIRGQVVKHTASGLGNISLEENQKLRIHIAAAPHGRQPVRVQDNGLLEFEIEPGETIMLSVKVVRNGFDGEVSFGKEDSGRNLPHGVFVDNIGLNGLLLLEHQTEREFFITAAEWVPEQSRLFHLRTAAAGGHASRPVLLHVRRKQQVAER